MKNKNEYGFTLVELLAVIVILAIILVIAVPQIMDTINDATKASFESSAKMVASQVENQYTVAQTLNKPFGETGNCMQEWAGLNENDYASCTYEILEGGTAKVTLEGKNKFKNLWACEATRSNATATEEKCTITCKDDEILVDDECVKPQSADCFDFEDGAITGYDISCGTDVVIPSKINGVDVVEIGEEAFFDMGITSVIFPNTITEIAWAAFSINQIIKLNIPPSVILIEDNAFNLNSLDNVYLGNVNAEISNCAFGDASTITTHNLPNNYICES